MDILDSTISLTPIVKQILRNSHDTVMVPITKLMFGILKSEPTNSDKEQEITDLLKIFVEKVELKVAAQNENTK